MLAGLCTVAVIILTEDMARIIKKKQPHVIQAALLTVLILQHFTDLVNNFKPYVFGELLEKQLTKTRYSIRYLQNQYSNLLVYDFSDKNCIITLQVIFLK